MSRNHESQVSAVYTDSSKRQPLVARLSYCTAIYFHEDLHKNQELTSGCEAQLRHSRPCDMARVRDRAPDDQLAGGLDRHPGKSEGRVGQAVSEGEPRRDAGSIEPSVPDEHPL